MMACQSDVQMLQRLQNSALQMILNEDKYASTLMMHNQLNLLTLNLRRKHHLCHQIYEDINNLAPNYISDKLQKVEHLDSRTTRATTQDLLQIPRYRLQQTK